MRPEPTSTSSTDGLVAATIDQPARRALFARGSQGAPRMQSSRALLVLWAIGAVLTFGACDCSGAVSPPGSNGGSNVGGSGSDGGTGSDGGSDGGTVLACVQPGAACVSGMPCCSGVCDGTTCTTAAFCQANGGSCSNDTDCCLNSCVNGTCSDQVCKDVGQSCGSATECCTGTCTGGTCASLAGGSCKVLGQTCSSGAACCSANCQSGFCAKAYSCQPIGDVCRSDDECCGHACTASAGGVGRCASVSGGGGGGCDQAGELCSGGSNCCSRICIDPGSGVTVCQAAEGCRLTGTWCVDDQTCCGGGTNPNGSAECRGADAGITGRCDQGNACNPVGNICGARVLPDGGSINAPQDCCDGQKDVCKLDSSGIPRCFGGGSASCPTGYTGQAGCCIAAGNECQFKDQCCGGAPCVPGPNGKLVCTVASCAPVGSSCSSSAQCCSGSDCRPTDTGYACQTSVPDGGDGGTQDAGTPDAGVCQANGTSCTLNGDCCSDRCIGDPGNRTCQAPLACQPQGSVCTTTADCCSGYACSFPTGSTTGTCQTSSCTGPGQACTVNDQCCTGLSCLDSTNYYCSGTGDCTCRALLN
jgi:hypothetical protein